MPPAALISSTRMRMPFTVAWEKLTTGPDKSCAVPMTISVGDTPCCASAGVAMNNASVATAMYFMVAFSRYRYLRHGRVYPGHPRLDHWSNLKDVDARHKAGHDGLRQRTASRRLPSI